MTSANSDLPDLDALFDFEHLLSKSGPIKSSSLRNQQKWKYDIHMSQRATSEQIESPIVKLLAKGFMNLKCDLSLLKSQLDQAVQSQAVSPPSHSSPSSDLHLKLGLVLYKEIVTALIEEQLSGLS